MDPDSFFERSKKINKLVEDNNDVELKELLSSKEHQYTNTEAFLATAVQLGCWKVATTLVDLGAKVSTNSVVHAICEEHTNAAQFFIEQLNNDLDIELIQDGISELCPSQIELFNELVDTI
jgi:hypothetical protein